MKIGPVEIQGPEWESIGKILNSRMGLALLVYVMLTYGLGPKIDAVLLKLEQFGGLLNMCINHNGERTAGR